MRPDRKPTHGEFPTISVVDSDLMVSVPPKFTAYQGMEDFIPPMVASSFPTLKKGLIATAIHSDRKNHSTLVQIGLVTNIF